MNWLLSVLGEAVGSPTTRYVAVPILAAFVASAGTYLGVRRRNSGKVDTSDAAVIFEAAEQLRKEMRDEIVELRQQLAAAHREADALDTQLREAHRETDRLTRRNEALEERVRELEARVSDIPLEDS